MNKSSIHIPTEQWGFDYETSLVFKWSKVVGSPNGLVYECHLYTRLNLVRYSDHHLNTGYLNTRLVKVHYSDASVIQMFVTDPRSNYLFFCLVLGFGEQIVVRVFIFVALPVCRFPEFSNSSSISHGLGIPAFTRRGRCAISDFCAILAGD